jgi:hypothetical protein
VMISKHHQASKQAAGCCQSDKPCALLRGSRLRAREAFTHLVPQFQMRCANSPAPFRPLNFGRAVVPGSQAAIISRTTRADGSPQHANTSLHIVPIQVSVEAVSPRRSSCHLHDAFHTRVALGACIEAAFVEGDRKGQRLRNAMPIRCTRDQSSIVSLFAHCRTDRSCDTSSSLG